jgi:hypothetical protein
MKINDLKRYEEAVILTVIFALLVIIVNYVLNRYFPFLKTSPHSTYEIIFYGILSPFNEAHEDILLNFYLLIPAFIATGVFYKMRIEKWVKFRYAFLFSIIATWSMYTYELLIQHTKNAAGTSIIGVSLFSISILAIVDISLGYKKLIRTIRSYLMSLFKLSLYVGFIFFITVYTFSYWISYFLSNHSSIYLHLNSFGIFILISFTYILIKDAYLKRNKRLDLG